jgi:hypothetical protein
MNKDFRFSIKSVRFDENYNPTDGTRLTTNFANLARGQSRQENLRNALRMIDNRFNALAHWDNPTGDRYSVEIDIISAELYIDTEDRDAVFPAIEILKTNIVDRKTDQRIDGITGNNFSSYVRDYDFSVWLLEHNKNQAEFSIPAGFGDLHANIFKSFLKSTSYRDHFHKPPVICLSVSDRKVYQRAENYHPVLGFEYKTSASSLTDQYFNKMGLQIRYFMPPNSAAPLSFYFSGDLLNDYTNLELISTISTMETFQKIYRPEIYNANFVAGQCFQPRLDNQDYSVTRIVYDREERSRLAVEQGKYTEKNFIKPFQNILERWSARCTV